MTYQIIYSSESTMPMQSDDLEVLLEQSRAKNGSHGISGALVYAESMFLQILEGPMVQVQALMARIARDVRHENIAILQEGEIPAAQFGAWNMAYVSATAKQVARWAGIDVVAEHVDGQRATGEVDGELRRTVQFAQDILALLESKTPGEQHNRREPEVG